MSRLIAWHLSNQLQNMGWPKTKGLLRKTPYVLTQLVDIGVQQGLQVCMALGAGRPELGGRLIADIYSENPWTLESTESLLQNLSSGEEEIASSPHELPWEALWAAYRLAPSMSQMEWEKIGSIEISWPRYAASAKAAYWGLAHHDEMAAAFNEDQQRYKEGAKVWVPHGLDVPLEFPWRDLDDLYESCEQVVTDFESERPPLPSIPKTFRNTLTSRQSPRPFIVGWHESLANS